MRILVVALVLGLAIVALPPTASAEPCEVPGCQVVPFALCVVADAKDYKHVAQNVADCATQPA